MRLKHNTWVFCVFKHQFWLFHYLFYQAARISNYIYHRWKDGQIMDEFYRILEPVYLLFQIWLQKLTKYTKPLLQDFLCTGWDSKQTSHEMQVYGHKQTIHFMTMLVEMLPNEVRFVAGCRLSGVLGRQVHRSVPMGHGCDGWKHFRIISTHTHTLGRP